MTTQTYNVPALRFPAFDEQWEIKDLENTGLKVIDGDRGSNYPNGNDFSADGYCLFLNAKNVTSSGFSFTEKSFISKEKDEQLRKGKLKRNDLVLTTRGTVGNIAFYDEKVPFEHLRINSGMVLIRNENSNINQNYIYIFLASPAVQKEISNIAFGSAQPQLSVKEINKFKISLPPLPEQQKIAAFLTTVGEKIQQLTKKKDLLEQYKKGVMQQIFNQDIRFKDDNGNDFADWEEETLGTYLTHKSTRNNDLSVDLVLSVNNKKGFITQQEQFEDHVVASKDLSNYKIVSRNDYAYNPSRINVGSIARLKQFDSGIVSPMYVVFRTKNTLQNEFFDYLYQTHYFKYLIKIGCSGSVRDSLNFDAMCEFVIKVPTLPEQRKVANFLSAIDEKIKLVNQQLEKTQTFKKGLLQQMFI